MSVLERQAAHNQEQIELQRRQLQLRAIDACDGQDSAKFIAWLKGVESIDADSYRDSGSGTLT